MKKETAGDLLTSRARGLGGGGEKKVNVFLFLSHAPPSFSCSRLAHLRMLAHPFLKTTSVYIQATRGELGHI